MIGVRGEPLIIGRKKTHQKEHKDGASFSKKKNYLDDDANPSKKKHRKNILQNVS